MHVPSYALDRLLSNRRLHVVGRFTGRWRPSGITALLIPRGWRTGPAVHRLATRQAAAQNPTPAPLADVRQLASVGNRYGSGFA